MGPDEKENIEVKKRCLNPKLKMIFQKNRAGVGAEQPMIQLAGITQYPCMSY
jgi:hypothetical protein